MYTVCNHLHKKRINCNFITWICIEYYWKEAKKLKTFVAFGDGTWMDGTEVGDGRLFTVANCQHDGVDILKFLPTITRSLITYCKNNICDYC